MGLDLHLLAAYLALTKTCMAAVTCAEGGVRITGPGMSAFYNTGLSEEAVGIRGLPGGLLTPQSRTLELCLTS